MAHIVLSAHYADPPADNHSMALQMSHFDGGYFVECSCGYVGPRHSEDEARQDRAVHLNTAIDRSVAVYRVGMRKLEGGRVSSNPVRSPIDGRFRSQPGITTTFSTSNFFQREMAISPLTSGLRPVQHDLGTCQAVKKAGKTCGFPVEEDLASLGLARFGLVLCVHHYQQARNPEGRR